jgi:PleD family two-component response regulator
VKWRSSSGIGGRLTDDFGIATEFAVRKYSNDTISTGIQLRYTIEVFTSFRRAQIRATVSCNRHRLQRPFMNCITQTVLLVDDNTLVRRGLRTLFESAGFVCSESQNGAEAIERVKELKPDYIVR